MPATLEQDAMIMRVWSHRLYSFLKVLPNSLMPDFSDALLAAINAVYALPRGSCWPIPGIVLGGLHEKLLDREAPNRPRVDLHSVL